MATTEPVRPEEPTGLRRYVSIARWLPTYRRSWLAPDIIAGLTLWGLIVPEAMAYAGIAGLPPQVGLYTLCVSFLAYAVLGTSRHLSVAPTPGTAALLAASVAAAVAAAGAGSDEATYLAYAAAFVLVVGVVFLLAGAAKLGFIAQFISKPVMNGFIMGLATFVAVGQLHKLIGIEAPEEGNTVEEFVGTLQEIPESNWAAVVVSAVTLAALFLLPRLSRRLPVGLVVLFAAIALSRLLDLEGTYDIEVVGELPAGLPSFAIPDIPLDGYLDMILPAIGVLLVAYSESLGIAREFAQKHGYEVDPNQELNALGGANVVSGLFGGMIAAGGMSGTAVKDGAGARTQVASLVTWGATIVTVLVLTPLFASLPEPVLAALIIHALWSILTSRKLFLLRTEAPVRVWFGVLTFLGVIFLDVLAGMVIGILASLLFVLYRSSQPHIASLGRVPGVPGAYTDLGRHPENEPVPGVVIARIDAQLYFANALPVRDGIRALVASAPDETRAVVISLGASGEIDATSGEALVNLAQELQSRGKAVYLCDVLAPVLEQARRMNLLDVVGDDHVLPTIDAAVRHIQASKPPADGSR